MIGLVPRKALVAAGRAPKVAGLLQYMVASGLSFDSEAATDSRDLELVGAEGVVEADCRPAGMARLLGRRVDVVARGEWIEAGKTVKVVEVRGNRVVIARVSPPAGKAG